MKKRSLLIISILVVFAVLFTSACSSSAKQTENKPEETAKPDAKASYVMKLGHVASPNSQRHKAAVELARRVEEKTNGALKIEVYPAGQLGDNPQTMQAVQAGTIEGVLLPTLYTSGFHEIFNVLDLPFLFPDAETALAKMQGPAGEELLATVESKGMKALAFWVQWTNIVVADFPATSPEAFVGKKFRTMPSTLVMDRIKEWGGSPISMGISELYNALQQKVMSGSEMTFTEIFDFKLHETVKYITKTNTSTLNEVVMVNKKWFDSLPADIQKVLKEETVNIAQYRLDIEKEGMDERWAKVKEAGKNEIIELTPEQIKAFESSAPKTIEAFFQRVPEAKKYYDLLKS